MSLQVGTGFNDLREKANKMRRWTIQLSYSMLCNDMLCRDAASFGAFCLRHGVSAAGVPPEELQMFRAWGLGLGPYYPRFQIDSGDPLYCGLCSDQEFVTATYLPAVRDVIFRYAAPGEKIVISPGGASEDIEGDHERLVGNIRSLLPHVRDKQVTLLLQHFDCRAGYPDDLDSAVRAVMALGSQQVRLLLDVRLAFDQIDGDMYQDVADYVRRNVGIIGHIRVSGFSGSVLKEGGGELYSPSQEVCWKTFAKSLTEIGYVGAVELFYPPQAFLDLDTSISGSINALLEG